MHLTLDDGRPAHLTRVHAALTSLPEADQARLGVTTSWNTGSHQLTYRQVEHTFRLITAALAKDEPDGPPAQALQAACDQLLEATIPAEHAQNSTALAADWTDIEAWSRPPRHGRTECHDPQASWGHRNSNLPGPKGEMFFGYYLSAVTMTGEENGPAVPELARRMTVCSCARDPARALVPVLEKMPADGIPLGDIIADSGYSHRVPADWATPLRRAGASLVQDLMGTWQATATRALGVKLSVQSAGPVSQIDACPGLSTWMPWCREAVSGRRGWCRVTRTIDQGLTFTMRSGPRRQPPLPHGASRHAGPNAGNPGAGAGMGGRGLSHPQDGPLTLTGAAELQPGPGPCGQLGSRTANRMAVPLSPSIRERA